MIDKATAIHFLINQNAAASPAVIGLSSDPNGSNPVTITFKSGATQIQKDAANAIALGADISVAGLAAIESQMNQAAASPEISNPGNLEILLRAVVAVILDELNTLRALNSLAPRTLTQAKTAIKSKIDAGLAN